MNIGMLWFDNDSKSEITKKVNKAVLYYRNKYKKEPTLCFVNPKMMPVSCEGKPTKRIRSGKLDIRCSPSILPNHFWIGINHKKKIRHPQNER